MTKDSIKTFLFDFDGTLVDSMPTFVTSMIKILDENNVKYPDDIVKIITPLGLNGAAEYFIELGIKMSLNDIIDTMKNYMLNEYLYNISEKSNVISTLNQLKNQCFDLNVLTASPHVTLDACLKRLGIYDLFTNVWSCDDFKTTKTDVNIYKMVSKKLDVEIKNIMFLDDNINALQTAKDAGMTICGVYDDSSKKFTDEIKSISNFYISDFAELLD